MSGAGVCWLGVCKLLRGHLLRSEVPLHGAIIVDRRWQWLEREIVSSRSSQVDEDDGAGISPLGRHTCRIPVSLLKVFLDNEKPCTLTQYMV
jgi:hypothetical protein